MRRLLLVLVAALAAGLLAVAASARTPLGTGLYTEHESSCSGAFTYQGLVTLVPGSGSTFWVDGHHLVIQSFEYKYDDSNEWTTVSFGSKTGQTTGPMETCQGHFDGNPGYNVVSHSVVVP